MLENEGRLLAEGTATPLGARAVQLLAALIAHRHRVVGKSELMALVWPGAQVREGNLHMQISNLRAVLGDGAIATVPMRGYRFTLPLDHASALPYPPQGEMSQPADEATTYRFGRHELRPAQRQLLLDGEPLKLGARAHDVLLALVERRDRVVPKSELMDIVWPDTVVEEGNLQTQVSLLRKLVGDQVLETIPGRGYRFRAPLLKEPSASRRETGAHEASIDMLPPAYPRELKTNLPSLLAPLLGRDEDLAQLGALVAEHRLVSIVATGGMGKSRLAQHMLHLRRSAYRHGVCWVEVAQVPDGSGIPAAIASALGVPLGAGDELAHLVGVLRELDLLVCLDNVEYLADEIAHVVQALHEGAPGTRLLVTSQVPLKLASERIYRLAPLAIPGTDAIVADAMRFGAVALFHERAGAADRRFRIDADNLGDVVDICHKLDGMPLAIELTAARVPLLGVQTLAAALDERLALLTSGQSGAPQRHQTLRAALEWSHGLLSEEERVVFRRLSVFAGSFSLDMAQQVVADSEDAYGLGAWDVLDLLGNLVDRSLVVALDEVSRSGLLRYRLLESPKALATELLRQLPPEERALRHRHAQAVKVLFTKMDEDRWEGRFGVDVGIAALEPDLDNAREAMKWLLENDHLGAVTMAPAFFYGFTYDRFEECRHMWKATETVIADDMPLDVRAYWAMKASHFYGDNNPDGQTLRFAQFAVDSFHKLGYRTREILARSYLLSCASAAKPGNAAHRADAIALEGLASTAPMSAAVQHELQFALAMGCFNSVDPSLPDANLALEMTTARFQRAFDSAKSAQNRMGRTGSATGLTYMFQVRGDLAPAIQLMKELALELDSGRDAFVYALLTSNLLSAYIEIGNFQAAEAVSAQTLRRTRPFAFASDTIDALALLAALRQRFSSAAALLGHADELYERRGTGRQTVEVRMVARARNLAIEALGEETFERLRIQGRSLTAEQADVLALAGQPDLDHSQNIGTASHPHRPHGHIAEPQRGA